MKINILSDTDWDSRVNKVLDNLSDFKYRNFFVAKNYGTSLDEIIVVLICRNPTYQFKQRIRFEKKEKRIYMDIILDLNLFRVMSQTEREKSVAQRLVSDIGPIVSKYKLVDFDISKFQSDLSSFLKRIKWLEQNN